MDLVDSSKEGTWECDDLQQQIGVLKNNIFYGQTFLGIMNSVDCLSEISSSIVADLLLRRALWCRIQSLGIRSQASKMGVELEVY